MQNACVAQLTGALVGSDDGKLEALSLQTLEVCLAEGSGEVKAVGPAGSRGVPALARLPELLRRQSRAHGDTGNQEEKRIQTSHFARLQRSNYSVSVWGAGEHQPATPPRKPHIYACALSWVGGVARTWCASIRIHQFNAEKKRRS